MAQQTIIKTVQDNHAVINSTDSFHDLFLEIEIV